MIAPGRSRLFLFAVAAVAVVLTLVLIGSWFLGSAFAFLSVFPWIVSSLTDAGVHPHLARALAVPAAIVGGWAVGQALSMDRGRRRRGVLVFVALYGALVSAMWLMTRQHNFDPVTGAALRKYAETPYGYEEVPAQWNVHPIFGTAALSMTPDIARSIEIQRQMGTFVSAQDRLFGPDGSALVWFCETPEDGIELFRSPGRHPRKNLPLKPITANVAKRLVTESREVAASSEETLATLKLEGLRRLRGHLQRTAVATSH